MAKELLITDIVGQEAFRQVASLSERLQELRKVMKSAVDEGKAAAREMLGGLSFNPADLDGLYKKNAAYNEQQKKLIEVENRLKETQKQYEDVLKKVNVQVREAVRQAREKAELDLKTARAVQAQEKAEQAKYQTLIKEVQAERALANATKGRTVTEAQITEALNTQARSIKEAQVQNRVLREAVAQVILTEENASQKIEAYNKKIDENSDLINKNSDAMLKRKQNIGNYASAFDGLGFSMQQVVRELPSVAVGLNTFFLAISNNLPILADEIARARQELKLMNEQGLKGTPVWRQLVSSLLSWQTAMVAGITVLSVYGREIGEWVMSLFSGKERLDAARESMKAYNEAMLEGGKNAQDEAVRLKLLYDAAVDSSKGNDERKRAIDELQRVYPAYFANMDDEAIKAGGAADAYMRLSESITASARAKAAQAKIVEQQSIVLENEVRINEAYARRSEIEEEMAAFREREKFASPSPYGNVGLTIERTDIQERLDAVDEEIAGYRSAIQQANRLSKELEGSISISDLLFEGSPADGNAQDDYADYIRGIEEQITEAAISAISGRKEREIAEINAEYDGREAAIRGNSEKEMQLRALLAGERARKIKDVETEYERGIREANLNSMMAYTREGSEEMLSYRLSLLGIQRDREVEEAEKTGAGVLEVERKYAALIQRERERFASLKADKFMGTVSSNSIVDGMAMNEQLRRLSGAYAQGKMSREEYEAENYRIQQEYAEKSLRLAVTTTESILSLDGLSDDDRMKYERQLAQAQMELDNMVTDNKIANDEAQVESERRKRKKQMELMQQVSGLLGQFGELGDQLFQNRIDQLDEESEANQEAYDREIENIEKLEESGAISTEEAEARKRAAEDKTKAKEEEIAKRKAELQTKQAVFDKTTSIAQAGIATALAIAKALPNLVLAGIVAAMGAVQIATILATPIPKYREGTDCHRGGIAVVGDGGVSETVLTPDGRVFLTPSVPVLVDLPAGTKVFPENIFEDGDRNIRSDALSLMDMRDGDGVPVILVSNDYTGLAKRIDRLERNMVRAFSEAARESRRAQYEAFKDRRI